MYYLPNIIFELFINFTLPEWRLVIHSINILLSCVIEINNNINITCHNDRKVINKTSRYRNHIQVFGT